MVPVYFESTAVSRMPVVPAVGQEGRTRLPVAEFPNAANDRDGPGTSHAIYSAQDVLGAVPVGYGLVLERAAQWVGCGTDDVEWLVERLERRVIRTKI